MPDKPGDKTELATLGGGCFWCIEAVFEGQPGVSSVVSGYAGGTTVDPDYEEVSTGKTGHAEVVQIAYDPDRISYGQILDLFFRAHDPSSLNRQGADTGTQYRSIILTHNEQQAEMARKAVGELEESGRYGSKVVTEIVPLAAFTPAEDYHQDYFAKNPNEMYCRIVIEPKLKKLGVPLP
jgi:peptide-methionine (S)-S-oxide reductase